MATKKESEPKKKAFRTFYARDKGGIEYKVKAIDASHAGFLFSEAFKKAGLNYYVDVREFKELK